MCLVLSSKSSSFPWRRERDGVAEGGNEGNCAANKFNFVLLGIICDHFRSPAGIKRPFADIGGGEGVGLGVEGRGNVERKGEGDVS